MTRKELYEEIKSLKLENEIKARTGKNFTNVSTDVLQAIYDEAIEVLKEAASCNKKATGKKSSKRKAPVSEEACNEAIDCPFTRLMGVLISKHILLNSEVEYIMDVF